MSSSNKVAFDRFEFDGRTLELFKDGRRVALAPKPGTLLRALLTAAPDIVSREQAQALLWPEGMHVEAEQGLNACVRQLRAALGDSASSPRFIETLPKRGYRFLAPQQAAHAKNPPAANRTILRSKSALVAAGVAAAAVLFAVSFRWNFFPEPGAASPEAQEMLARAFALRTRDRGDDLERALVLYDGVIAEAPRSADAVAGKALALIKASGRAGRPRDETYRAALKLADDADELAPRADAAAARGFALLYGRFDPAPAKRAFDEALQRDKSHAEALAGKSATLAILGELGAAVDAANEMTRLHPLSYAARSDRCWYLLFARRHAEARDACAWAIEIEGDHASSHLGLAIAAESDTALAEKSYRAFLDARGLDPREGDIADGKLTCQAAARVAETIRDRGPSPYEAAALFALCGDAARAALWLQRAIDEKRASILFTDVDPRFDPVREALPDTSRLLVK